MKRAYLMMESTKLNGKDREQKKRRIFRIWTERSLLERILLIFTSILFLSLVIITIISIHKELSDRNRGPKICTNPDCIKQATSIFETLDTTSDPCQDFYRFSCGSYRNHHALEDETSIHSAKDDLQNKIFLAVKNILENPEQSSDKNLEQAKKFYSACINNKIEGTLDAVARLLRTSGIGEWPISDRKRNPTFDSKLGVLTAHGRNPFFETTINNLIQEHGIKIYPSDEKMTQLKDHYYFNDINTPHEAKTIYHKFILNSLIQMGVQPDIARKDASNLMEFESNLANITKQVHDSTTQSETLSSMENVLGGLHWMEWFKKFFSIGYLDLQENIGSTPVLLEQPERLKRIFKLIKSVEHRVVDNYLMWRFVVDLLPLLDSSFRRSYNAILPYMHEDSNPMYRKRKYFFEEWKQCVHITSDVFRKPIAIELFKRIFDEDISNRVEETVDSLKEVFKESLSSQHWLDKDTKTFLKSKMEQIFIGMVNDETMNDKTLEDFMKYLTINDDYTDALLQVERAFFILNSASKNMESLFVKYSPLSAIVDYYIPQNTLVVATGILMVDINNIDSPKSLVYGSLGTSLAHKMYFSYHEYLLGESEQITNKDVISNKDRYKYEDRTRCFKGQQAIYSVHLNIQKANKTLILGDMIAYNVGLKTAYEAYQNYIKEHEEDSVLPVINLTNNQIFFLRFAQTMCEIRDRKDVEETSINLNEILFNSVEFSNAFGCSSDSVMNPKDKCSIWE